MSESNGDLPLREPSEERPEYEKFINPREDIPTYEADDRMHKHFAAFQLHREEEKKYKEAQKKEKAKEEEKEARPVPKLMSPIEFQQERKKDSKERFNNVAKTIENKHMKMARDNREVSSKAIVIGFDGTFSMPYYKFRMDDEIIKGVDVNDEDNGKKKVAACLAEMPKEVIKGILAELPSQWQVCFALSSKRVAKISKEINKKWGIVYNRPAKFHILWRLESWMGASRKLCMACELYHPTAPGYWMGRKEYGPCRTASTIYGRNYKDFEFEGGFCPECVANRKWRSVCRASATLQTSPFS
ncbi:hypothetical protein FQN54_009235 [Arachnomyces sp. PD_36]|nr:hypothetical protein FQN54_009235 [Arachnomyces sp. PD_36]